MAYIFNIGAAEMVIMNDPTKKTKKPGLYIFQKPNGYIKLATFINDEAVETLVNAAGRR